MVIELDAATRRALQPGNVYVDLSSVAKGFGTDQIARWLEREGVTSYLVDISGELRAPMLPESAIQTDERGSYVLLVDGNGTVIRRNVTVGPVTDRGIPVLGGLSGNEKVVLSAGAFLNPGEKVVPEQVRPGRD